MRYKIILSVALLLIVQIFIFQNMEIVPVRILFWTITVSRVFLMFFMLIIGIIVGWLLNSYFQYHKKQKETKKIVKTGLG